MFVLVPMQMSVHVPMRMSVHAPIHMSIHSSMHVYLHMSTCTRAYTHVYTHEHTLSVHMTTPAWTPVHPIAYTHIGVMAMRVCTHACTHAHTHRPSDPGTPMSPTLADMLRTEKADDQIATLQREDTGGTQ